MKRIDGEDFEKYQSRRQADNILTKIRMAHKVVWNSYGYDAEGKIVGRTSVKSRDSLVNSRAGQAPDAPRRPAGDQMHRRD